MMMPSKIRILRDMVFIHVIARSVFVLATKQSPFNRRLLRAEKHRPRNDVIPIQLVTTLLGPVPGMWPEVFHRSQRKSRMRDFSS